MTHNEKHGRLFDRIALPYSWFFAGQTRNYAHCFELGRSCLPDPRGKKALDIGCGTGAFTRALREEGWEATGVDIAPGMLAQARKKGLSCDLANVLGGLPYDAGSFDIVSAAYVAHGLKKDDRTALFLEMKRLSKGLVLFHDYTPDTRLLTSAIEYLEGGDYFNFIRSGLEEMKACFPKVEQLRVGKQAAWYLCSVQ
jgi:ubiquinone/menaquinone biosynthesis C-methylase UbiE